jgi:hypothetical protein
MAIAQFLHHAEGELHPSEKNSSALEFLQLVK